MKEYYKKFGESLLLVSKMQNIPRMGWYLYGDVPFNISETVVEHTFKVTYISIFLFFIFKKHSLKLNKGKIIEMAFMHDWHESILSDLPNRNTFRSLFNCDREEAEKKASQTLASYLIDSLNKEYNNLYIEFIEEKTKEAEVVKIADIMANQLEIILIFKKGIGNEGLINFYKQEKNRIQKYVNKYEFLRGVVEEIDTLFEKYKK